jgi:AcrR family transcriptional regulator
MSKTIPIDLTTKDRIAAAALAILEKEGAQAVSMRRVAEAVAITPMAIYHHFESRENLLDTITAQEFAKFLSYIERRPQKGTTEARLISAMEAYIDYAFDRPRVFDYVFAETRPGARRYPEDFRARRSPTLNPIADLVSGLMQSGALKKDDIWEVAFELWAHTHGYVALYRAGRFNLTQDQFRALVRRSLRRLVHGLKA